MKTSVYIETTIVSYLTAWPSRDLVRAAQQQITHEWWGRREQYDVYVSELVLTEVAAGDPAAAADRLAALHGLPLLRIGPEADELAAALVARLAIPPGEIRDASHVAIAATNGVGVLLTWNCRHLANLHQRARIERACRERGYEPPLIGTPNELNEVGP